MDIVSGRDFILCLNDKFLIINRYRLRTSTFRFVRSDMNLFSRIVRVGYYLTRYLHTAVTRHFRAVAAHQSRTHVSEYSDAPNSHATTHD